MTISWFNKVFQRKGGGASGPENVVRFYQQLGFFAGADPTAVVKRYTEVHGAPSDAPAPWYDVFLLSADGEVWADDPEADVCAENQVYLEVLPKWARLSQGAFAPAGLIEHWESDNGPITLSFQLEGQPFSVSPNFQDDWIDLEVLVQINAIIAPTGRQFECAVDGNFALVLCLTPEQKVTMHRERQFPFAW